MLRVENLHVSYGNVKALKGVSLRVNKGELVALIGSNGAGKTTLLKTIAGLLKPKSGSIFFRETDVTGLPPHKLVRAGVVLVPEGREVFYDMTVDENLELGFASKGTKADFQHRLEMVFELFPILKERRKQLAGTMSGGQQQMLAIARGLMSGPELLLLDEPSLGLAPIIVQELGGIIERLNREEMTVLLVEQNAILALELAQRGYVLENGHIVMQGNAEDLLKDENLKAAYLGI